MARDDWFDEAVAGAYDDEHDPAALDTAAAVETLAAVAGDGPVLELGIGTGRLALPLAARGVSVDGIDGSEAMVAQLRAKPGGADLDVIIGDFASVGSLVERSYALVFVAYNTLFDLGTQEAQVECMRGAAACLAPGGRFLVEAFVPDVSHLEEGMAVLDTRPDRVSLGAGRHDPLSQQVEWASVVFEEDGPSIRVVRARYATVPELDLMARLAGLRLQQRWGGWDRSPFTNASLTHVSVYERE